MFSKKSPEKNNPPHSANNSNTVLKNILNGMDAYIYVSDPATDEILFINDKMRAHFNLSKEKGIGSICWKVLQTGLTERCSFCPIYKLAKAPETTVVWEEHNTVTGGYYKNTDSFIDWEDGRKVHLQHSVDITQLKQAEQNLEDRVKQLELIAEITRKFISGEDIDNHIEEVLKMSGEFMGIEAAEFYLYNESSRSIQMQSSWSVSENFYSERNSIMFKEDDPLYKAIVKQKASIMTEDNISENDGFMSAKKFGLKSVMILSVVAFDKLLGVLLFQTFKTRKIWSESDKYLAGFIANILPGVILRKEAEKSLLRMSSIVEKSPQYITCTTSGAEYTYVNPAMTAITGYTKEELFRNDIAIINRSHPITLEERNRNLGILLKEGHVEFENIIDTKDGRQLIMRMSLFAIDEAKSEVACIATDMTEQRRLETELIKAKDLAESANQAKSEFLSRMSHEIRTPINAIMGMTTIAKGTDDIARKDYCLDKIDDASAHLLGVINDILDMSKIEAGKFELSESEYNLEKMIEKVINVVNFRIEQKHQNLIIDIESSIPRIVVGDEMRLSQVLTNLLTNASKFTPEEGTIRLSVIRQAQEGDSLTLRFCVQDNGIGISQEQQSRLFRSFEQADGSITRKFGGTGLGLAISKRIVELMGGSIDVESELNHGSKFIFTVKVIKGRHQLETRLDPNINLSNLHVLAVDDSKDIRDYFLNIMKKFGINCTVAEGPLEALKIIEDNKNAPFNIMFIDWILPDMDGIELTKRIKKINNENCVIIMISTAQWSEIEKEATKAGVDKFIGKPLLPSSIINIINESFSGGVMLNTKSESRSVPNSKQPNFEGHHILVAEDTEINRDIIKAFLQTTRVDIDFVTNGKEALDAFKANPDKYSLILMDVHMPKMDGLEATKAIRAIGTDKAKNIPIIALTANVFLEDIKECLAAGMNSHIGKPIDISSMFETLVSYMPKLEKKSDADASSEAAHADNGYSKYMPYINVEDGMSRLLNDKKFYFQMLNNFKGKKFADDLVNSIKDADFKTVAVAAHTLKGIAANLGLISLWDLSKEIEMEAKAEKPLSAYPAKVTETMDKTLELIAELTKS